MTDARIITREDVLELAEDVLITVFRAGYELGQKVACLDKPELKPERNIKLDIDPKVFTTLTGD